MRDDKRFSLAVLLLPMALIVACAEPSPSPESAAHAGAMSASLAAYVVNYPLHYFAQRIGGELVEVTFPVPRDVDPAFWSPDAEQVAEFQQADLVLLNGAGYARWVRNASLAPSRLVDTSATFSDRYLAIESGLTHTHGPEGEHDHGEIAFTTWLDMQLAIEQARAVARAFEARRPEGRAQFAAGLASLERDLLELDGAIRAVVAGGEARLVGSHPVYQYLARGYDLEIPSFHLEPDAFPDDAAWRELNSRRSEAQLESMLWEAAPLERIARRLADLGMQSVVFDPCANVPEKGDFLSVQRANVENLRRALGAGPAGVSRR